MNEMMLRISTPLWQCFTNYACSWAGVECCCASLVSMMMLDWISDIWESAVLAGREIQVNSPSKYVEVGEETLPTTITFTNFKYEKL